MTKRPDSGPLDARQVEDEDLRRIGARFAEGATPAARGVDALARYISVPNRMLIFYSSEDEAVHSYILRHWAALDRMSGEICDIYPSLMQIEGNEDAYSTIAELSNIPGASDISIRELPVILIWSDHAYAKIPIQCFSTDQIAVRTLFRHVFGALHDIGRGIADGDAQIITEAIRQAQAEVRLQDAPVIYVDRRTDMSTHNTAGPGSVIVSGGTTGDITLRQKWSESDVDMKALAAEFEKLREELRAGGRSPDHDIALGQVAAAEAAAKAGDRSGVMLALKSSGKWVLSTAEKIGVGLAVQAIKAAIGL